GVVRRGAGTFHQKSSPSRPCRPGDAPRSFAWVPCGHDTAVFCPRKGPVDHPLKRSLVAVVFLNADLGAGWKILISSYMLPLVLGLCKWTILRTPVALTSESKATPPPNVLDSKEAADLPPNGGFFRDGVSRRSVDLRWFAWQEVFPCTVLCS